MESGLKIWVGSSAWPGFATTVLPFDEFSH